MLGEDKRRRLRFALLFLLVFAVLAWPFPLIGRGYRGMVSSAVNGLVFDPTLPRTVVQLVPNQRPGFDWYLTTAVWNQNTRSVESQFDVDVYQAFWLPTAVYIALTFAGRFAWGGKRLVLKLLIGILLFQVRGCLRFIALERAVAGLEYGLVDLLLLLVNRSLVAPLGMAFALPLLLWFGFFRGSFIPSANGQSAAAC